MVARFSISMGLALLLALAFMLPALAGGWAVITLDELPVDVIAGEPLTIGFTVRQHGITPMDGLYPTIKARTVAGESLMVSAEPEGEPGHYIAKLTFPRDGNWEWSIQAFTMDQPMPALVVSAPGVAAPSRSVETRSGIASISPLYLLRILVFGIALIGLLFAFQRKSRLAGAFAGLCLLVGVGTFMIAAATPEVEAQEKMSSEAPASRVERGRQLFLAKGCITCHYNERAANRSDYWTIEMGAPDLSNYASNSEVLFVRLKDPSAAKSDTKMPNLGLKKTEIEALIAFINAK